MPGIAEELFVESDKLPIRLYCSICLDVAETAIITSCDHLYCKECIEQLQQANGINCECPNCRKPIQPISNALNARNFLSHQIVYCSEIESLRCGWTGKYSMWHTHKAKYCSKASKSDKVSAKNATFTEIGNLSNEELKTMSVGRLKKILQEYIKLNHSKLTTTQLQNDFNYKKFIEKNEYITAIIQFESIYGVSSQYHNHSPNKNKTSQFPTTYNGLKRLKIRELSSYLRSKNIDPSSTQYNCIEKSDLIHLVLTTQKHYKDIINGNAYDPAMEKQQFSPPPQIHNMELDEKDEIKENFQSNNNFNEYAQGNQQQQQQPSATAYSYNRDDLRRSSINRIDVNAVNNNNGSTYSHVYNNHQHATNVNRNNLENNYDSINDNANNNNQRMYNESNINNYNYSLHSHSNHYTQPQPQEQQPQMGMPYTNINMPQMPQMPQMTDVFGGVQMPNMAANISDICNTAMNTVNDTMNSVFGNRQ